MRMLSNGAASNSMPVRRPLPKSFSARARLSPNDEAITTAPALCLQTQGKEPRRCLLAQLDALDVKLRQVDELIRRTKDGRRDAPLRWEIGELLRQLGREQDAVSYYFAALGEDANYAPARAALADYFQRTGHHTRRDDETRGEEMRNKLRFSMIAAGIVVLAAAGVFWFLPRVPAPSPLPTLASPPAPVEASEERVHQFCGACHAYPPAETFPRAHWRKEIRTAYDFFRDLAFQLRAPSMESVALYYEVSCRSACLPPRSRMHQRRRCASTD